MKKWKLVANIFFGLKYNKKQKFETTVAEWLDVHNSIKPSVKETRALSQRLTGSLKIILCSSRIRFDTMLFDVIQTPVVIDFVIDNIDNDSKTARTETSLFLSCGGSTGCQPLGERIVEFCRCRAAINASCVEMETCWWMMTTHQVCTIQGERKHFNKSKYRKWPRKRW